MVDMTIEYLEERSRNFGIPITHTRDFVCARCNECCQRTASLALSLYDVLALSDHLKIAPGDFLEKYSCEISGDRQCWRIPMDGKCPFFNKDIRGCEVHNAKPFICREYPFIEPTAYMYAGILKKYLLRDYRACTINRLDDHLVIVPDFDLCIEGYAWNAITSDYLKISRGRFDEKLARRFFENGKRYASDPAVRGSILKFLGLMYLGTLEHQRKINFSKNEYATSRDPANIPPSFWQWHLSDKKSPRK